MVDAVVVSEADVSAENIVEASVIDDVYEEEPESSKKYRNFVFTCNNYDDECIRIIKSVAYRYLIFGFEVAPSTGTPHLQGFVAFSAARSWQSFVNEIGSRFRVRVARAAADKNRIYCSKSGNFFEDGDMPVDRGAVSKERWEKAFVLSRDGKFGEIDPDIRFRFYSTTLRIRDDYLAQQQLDDNCVFLHQLYYGVYGTGKSYRAKMLHGKENVFMKMCNKWWDGYAFQPVVIIDDICPEQASFMTYFLKIWLDERPFICDIKRRSTKIRPKKFILTSNYAPDELWPKSEDRLAILDRLTVTKFTELDRVPGVGRRKISDREILVEDGNFGVPVNIGYVRNNLVKFSLPADWGSDPAISYQEDNVE